MNLIDTTLACLQTRRLAQALVTEELLFIYTVFKKERGVLSWAYPHFGQNRDYVFFLFAVCALSYSRNPKKNLFEVFKDWSYQGDYRQETPPALNWQHQPRPEGLTIYSCFYKKFDIFNLYQLDLSEQSLKEIYALIKTSETLSVYTKMIDDSCLEIEKQIHLDFDWFHRFGFPIPDKGFKPSPIDFWSPDTSEYQK